MHITDVFCHIPSQNQVFQTEIYAQSRSHQFDGRINVDWTHPLLYASWRKG